MCFYLKVLVCLFVFSFLVWTIFKVFNELVTVLLLLFMFWFFGHEAYGILAPNQGSNLHPCMGRQILTTGPPGKSFTCFLIMWSQCQISLVFEFFRQQIILKLTCFTLKYHHFYFAWHHLDYLKRCVIKKIRN